MKEVFGHKLTREKIKPPRKIRAHKKIRIKPDYLAWCLEQEHFTVLDFVRNFMVSETTAGDVLRKFAQEGKLKQLPRGHKESGLWVKI